MKNTLLAAAAALTLITGTAIAGEGKGEPFPFRAAGLTVSASPALHADTGSAAYPDVTGRPAQLQAAINPDLIPPNGSEGSVQTANSLPAGSSEGTVAYAQAQSVMRYLAQQASRPAEMAQR